MSLARALFERGVPVDARAVDGATPLLVAASSGHVATLRLLVERGAGVNLADQHGDTALRWATVPAGSIESVKLLLAAGADVNARDLSRPYRPYVGRRTADGADVMDALRARGAQGDISEFPRTPLTPQAAVERSLPLIRRGHGHLGRAPALRRVSSPSHDVPCHCGRQAARVCGECATAGSAERAGPTSVPPAVRALGKAGARE